jgi:hypothetical protein
MKALLLTLLMVAGSVMADSGLYYDPGRNGEGLSLHTNGDTVVGFLFTYGGEDSEVSMPIPPYVSPQFPLEEPLNGQRWFLLSPGTLVGDCADGELYIGGGVNYPVPLVPNGIGDVRLVALYTLCKLGDGWQLLVERTEDSPLAEDDPLFLVNFDFDVLLFSGD